MINRRNIRVEVQLQVKFRIEGDPDNGTFRGVTRNISRSGVCILAHEDKSRMVSLLERKLPKVMLSIYLTKDDKLIDIQSRTAWISSKVGWFVTPEREGMPLLIGTSFENITKEDAGKMDFFMGELMKGDNESIEEIKAKLVSKLNKMRPDMW